MWGTVICSSLTVFASTRHRRATNPSYRICHIVDKASLRFCPTEPRQKAREEEGIDRPNGEAKNRCTRTQADPRFSAVINRLLDRVNIRHLSASDVRENDSCIVEEPYPEGPGTTYHQKRCPEMRVL